MAVPSSIKITKNGIEYISKVDRTKYALKQLVHAANKDVGKYLTKRTKAKITRRTGRGRKYTQYWARKEGDLQVGYKPAAFYLGFDELGTNKRRKIAQLANTVQEEKNEIRKIQGMYIKSIEDENKALRSNQ
ncbi:MAG: hypothetical protein HFJ52_04080 [Clostridia bacterium]|nr:hypothetical protein [Clostridia bacterium]